MKIIANITYEDNVSGARRHGAIYPMFSRTYADNIVSKDAENYERIYEVKISCEDGIFEKASNRIGYTGQHTNLTLPGICLEPGRYSVNPDSPYIYGELFSRNKYGCTKRFFRLNCVNRKLEHQVGKNRRWAEFVPKNYLD